MSKMRFAVVLVLVMVALACDDGGGSDGNPAGTGGLVAGTGAIAAAGASGMAGIVAGTGGVAGSAGASGMAGMMAGGTGGMAANCIGAGTTPQPTFTWFYDNVVPNCGGPVCHTGPAGGNLIFDSKDSTHAQLMLAGMAMNVVASTSMTHCKDTGLTRVVPNNPDASLLYAKLRTDRDPPCGNRMPPGGELCAPALEALRMWIASGALNN
jgi:hypothetical protein